MQTKVFYSSMQNVPLNYNAKVSLCLSLFAMEEV